MSGADQFTVKSLQGKVSEAEWNARVDLAACYRLIDHFGMSDIGANHISLRVPGEDEASLLNAYGMMYEEITASSLVKIGHEGKVLAKPEFGGGFDYGINMAGFVIHGAIHKARPEINCVIHTHTWPGMAVSALKEGLLPLAQTSMRFVNISYHDYQGGGTGCRRAGLAGRRSRRQRRHDPAQPWIAHRGPHGRRGVQ